MRVGRDTCPRNFDTRSLSSFFRGTCLYFKGDAIERGTTPIASLASRHGNSDEFSEYRNVSFAIGTIEERYIRRMWVMRVHSMMQGGCQAWSWTIGEIRRNLAYFWIWPSSRRISPWMLNTSDDGRLLSAVAIRHRFFQISDGACYIFENDRRWFRVFLSVGVPPMLDWLANVD